MNKYWMNSLLLLLAKPSAMLAMVDTAEPCNWFTRRNRVQTFCWSQWLYKRVVRVHVLPAML